MHIYVNDEFYVIFNKVGNVLFKIPLVKMFVQLKKLSIIIKIKSDFN